MTLSAEDHFSFLGSFTNQPFSLFAMYKAVEFYLGDFVLKGYLSGQFTPPQPLCVKEKSVRPLPRSCRVLHVNEVRLVNSQNI